MQEYDERFADSGKPVKQGTGLSRRTALKVGGIGLAGAFAGLLPSRAGAALRRSTALTACGAGSNCSNSIYPTNKCTDASGDSCICYAIYYGRLRRPGAPVAACGNGDYWDDLCGTPCNGATKGPGSCPAGSFCADPHDTCCSGPVCVPYCGHVVV